MPKGPPEYHGYCGPVCDNAWKGICGHCGCGTCKHDATKVVAACPVCYHDVINMYIDRQAWMKRSKPRIQTPQPQSLKELYGL